MDMIMLLIINGFLLSFILLILLIIMASKNGRKSKNRGRIKSDLRKIKEQISS